MIAPELKEKIDSLPQSPGCYLMHDKQGVIMYVGKAINLRARVRQYFLNTDTRAFVQILDTILGDIEVLITGTEKEALLLENVLIKEHKPRFNVMLRDDKNFISLRLDVTQPYPRLEIVRRVKRDGARYFGPYSSASAIRETLRVLNRYFQLRTCQDSVFANRRRPCLQYQIKRCPAPCVYDVPVEDYRRSVENVTLFLQGKTDELTDHLRARMKLMSSEMRYEEAALLRDQIVAIGRSLEKQQAVSVDAIDQDIFGFYREGPLLLIQVLFVRKGRLSGGRHFSFKGQEFPDDELLGQFLEQYYSGGAFVPKQVLLPWELDSFAAREELLTERKGERVYLLTPQRGAKVRLIEMARENAEHNYREWRQGEKSTDEVLVRLMNRLKLSKLPRRIECYDNSHLQGTLAVGSRVTFSDGEPDKTRYRHYKVKTANTDDDYQMMYEVLSRRLSRGKAEADLPDLIVVDGGKGQLNVARTVLREQGLEGAVDLASLAEGKVVDDERLFAKRQGYQPEAFKLDTIEAAPIEASPERGAGKSRNAGRYKKDAVERAPDRVFLPGQKNPIVLRANSAELFLLQRLRDEAHRFANSFQRQLRKTANFRSVLREIPGVGEKRQKTLLRHFGSLRRIREAAPEELAKVEGFNAKLAEEVWRFFHANKNVEHTDMSTEAEEMALADAGVDELEDELDPDSAQVFEELADELEPSALSET